MSAPRYPKATWMGQTPNVGGHFAKGEPRFITHHYTAGGDAEASAHFLFKPHSPASSAHFVVGRDGKVWQISEIDRVTWHAGKSAWKGIIGLNSHAIGIENANFGFFDGQHGEPVHSADAAKAAGWKWLKHKNRSQFMFWEPYPEAQIEASLELTTWLLKTFPTIKEIVGHDDIAPTRKTDPGPAFPMQRFQALLHL